MRFPDFLRQLRLRPRTARRDAEQPDNERSNAEQPDSERPGGWRRAANVRLMLIAATVLALVVAAVAGYAHRQADGRDTAARQALRTAGPAAKAIFSYDYRTFDVSVANGKTFVTGDFAKEYAETTAALKATATAEKAVVLANVSAASVVRAETDGVELLLYLNQYRRNANITGEKVDQNRVVLHLVRVGGDWKVDRAIAI